MGGRRRPAEAQREALTLFYVSGHAHREIAEFLEISLATVNNRLRAARRALKENLIDMVQDELAQHAPSRDEAFATAVAFCAAAEAGDLEQVRRILATRPELVQQTHPQHRRKALLFAAESGHAEVVELLLAAGADPLEDFHQSYSPCALVLARRAGHYGAVDAIESHYRRLLESDDPQLEARDAEGNTLLHLAVYHRYRELASALLERGADPDARNRWGQRPIDLALFSNSEGLLPWEARPDGMMAALLLQGGATMDIWVACALGETHLVRRFLEQDPTLANYYSGARRHPGGVSWPLAIAAWRGHTQAARLLLDHGAHPDCPNRNDVHDEDYDELGDPLILAIHRDHLDIAHLLLDRGASADVKIYAGYTALELAMNRDDQRLVERLIAGGARLHPAELAAKGNYLAVAEILDRSDAAEAAAILLGGVRGVDETVVRMSLAANPELGPGDAYRILSNVVRYDRSPDLREQQERVFRTILEHGIDGDALSGYDFPGFTMLHGLSHQWWMSWLAEDGPERYAAMLLEHGADLEARDANEGLTPLEYAARHGRRGLVELLLKYGAREKAKARAEAKKNGFAEVAALLA